LSNLTPKAVPYKVENTLERFEDSKIHIISDNDRTLKKNDTKKSHDSSDFDEEEDMPDAKDFEEFDYAAKSVSSNSNSSNMQIKVHIID
jgi:hypothetical protein